MEIAKRVSAKHFLTLNLVSTGANWDEAISILKQRINERFIEPTDKLIEFEKELPPEDKKYGFTIMALDCLLCETIQSFYEGVKNSKGKSKQIFKRFLQQRQHFKSFFVTEKQAEDFYYDVRCNLLHQAQTSAVTKIWTVGALVNRTAAETTINRLAFHEAIKAEFDIYLSLLADPNNVQLRNNFKNKMIYIATGE